MLDEPLGEADVRGFLRSALDGGELRFSGHAYEEMENDGLVEQDVRNCLWAGQFDGCDFVGDSWRYRMRTALIVAVVAFRCKTEVVVVTAWRDR